MPFKSLIVFTTTMNKSYEKAGDDVHPTFDKICRATFFFQKVCLFLFKNIRFDLMKDEK